MSEDRDLTFAPLTDGNYAEWEIHMEADLVDKGLWEYVFTEVVKPEGDTNSAKKAIREYHSGHFEGVLEAVLPSILVVQTFLKCIETVLNREHSFLRTFPTVF